VTAVAGTGAPFIHWTNSDVAVSATETYTLTAGSDYSLTAHFLSLTSSVPTGKIFTGGRITLTPSIPGGTWEWDDTFFSASFNSPATFTALKTGTSTITYTVEGQSVSYPVTAVPVLSLSSSVAGGKIYTGGRITLTPNITGGTWSFDNTYFSRNGNTFTALKTGTSTITYTVEGQSVTYNVTIEAAALPTTGQNYTWVWVLAGLAALTATLAVIVLRKQRRGLVKR
jgi:LPXTG-motif cell wall-anchored protein